VTEGKARFDASGDRWAVSGSLTMDSASELLEASAASALPAAGIVDLAGVDRVDSAGVAVLLAWKRRAAAEAKLLVFAGVPESMASLAQLYGVQELLAR
jgi:phospholipid transport system transporter-binding protein